MEERVERAEMREVIKELLGLDTDADPDPLIDLPMIAKLAGVADGTPGQWVQRSKKGQLKRPFPKVADNRYTDKPQWRAVSQVIPWLIDTHRWPPGAAGRPESRGPREQHSVAA